MHIQRQEWWSGQGAADSIRREMVWFCGAAFSSDRAGISERGRIHLEAPSSSSHRDIGCYWYCQWKIASKIFLKNETHSSMMRKVWCSLQKGYWWISTTRSRREIDIINFFCWLWQDIKMKRLTICFPPIFQFPVSFPSPAEMLLQTVVGRPGQRWIIKSQLIGLTRSLSAS